MPSSAFGFSDTYDPAAFSQPTNHYPFVGSYNFNNGDWIREPSGIQKLSDWFGFTDYQGVYDRQMQNNERAYERANIESARAWEEYLASTQWQRTKADLEKAGMNPWLALQGSLGSSSQTSSTSTGGSTGKSKSEGSDLKGLAALIVSVAKLLS